METKLQKQKAIFFTVFHEAREELKIGVMEYAVADTIAHLSSNQNNAAGGWCYMSKESMAKMLGLTKQHVFKIVAGLIKKNLIEREAGTGFLRPTTKWITVAVEPYRI